MHWVGISNCIDNAQSLLSGAGERDWCDWVVVERVGVTRMSGTGS